MPAHRPRLALPWAGLLLASVAVSAQTPAVDLDALLRRVGGPARALLPACAEHRVHRDGIGALLRPGHASASGRPRRLEYEQRVEWDAAGADGVPSVRVVRELRSVNGRPPGPEDENACLVPEAEGDDPLSVLLPARQAEFDFRLRDVEIVDGRPIAKLSFTPIDVQPGEVEWEGDCVRIELEGWYGGDAWVDVGSGDVLRLDEHLTRPFEFREPIDRPRASRRWSRLERDDTITRYERIAFEDPDETLMLPRSIERNWAVEGGGFIPRYFRTQRFSNYRRFVTDGRLVGAPGP